MLGPLGGGLLGLAMGLRHALEPDHLAAVSTLVAQERTPRAGAKLGAWWGLGHASALLAVGLSLSLARAEMPGGLADVFEFGVALLLIALGLRAIRRAPSRTDAGPQRVHRHGPESHRHGGPAGHVHVGALTFASRPLHVGVVHGLAGSGALTALLAAKMSSAPLRIAYLALFGLGAALGMAALSGLAGWPLARIGRSARAQRAISIATGAVAALLGVAWGYPFVIRWIS